MLHGPNAWQHHLHNLLHYSTNFNNYDILFLLQKFSATMEFINDISFYEHM
jgi:hypothetical protein